MKTTKYLMVASMSLASMSCGTKELKPDEYLEVGRGEKALLMTTNPDTFNMFDWLLADIFDSGNSLSSSVSEVDGKRIYFSHKYDNHHVLIEPGERTILINCSVHFKDKNKTPISSGNSIHMEFEGGFKYKVKFDSHDSYSCKSRIEPDEKYNKSLKKADEKGK